MAGGGVASGKISLSVELIENYKEIASKLKNGLKGNIKEIPLDATFDDKKIAKQVEEELNHINEALDSSKMKKLDWSNVIPPLSQILFDNSLEDAVRLQIIQGFRAGIDSMPHYLKSMFTQNNLPFERQKTGEQIAQQLIDSATLDEAISSMGLSKWNISRMRSGYRNILENPYDEANKDLAQIISMMSIKQDYADVLHLLVGGDSAPENAFKDLKDRFDKGEFRKPDLANAAGFVERLKYIADQKQGDSKVAATKVYEEAEKQLGQIFEQAMKPVGELGGGFTQEQLNNIIGDIRTQVKHASEARDAAYRKVNPSQYGQEGVSVLVAKIREMLQSGTSKNVEASITGRELGQTLDINSLFNIISGEEKDTSEVIAEEQRQNEERNKAFDELLQRMLEEADEKLSEEEKQRIERRSEQRKTEAIFHNLLRTRGKTGIDSGTENYYNTIDLESINDKFENDVELLKNQKTTIDNQIKKAQEAKTLLEKENQQIAEAVTGNFVTKGSRAAKKQLLEKQKAYDEADESGKETAWVEYYKAYQNMMKPENTPKTMAKALQERLATDFGENGDFNAANYTQHILNLKEQWVKNTTSLEDLLKTIGEFQAKKRLIDEKIAEPTTGISSNTTNTDQSKKTSSGDATQPIVRTIEEIKKEKANLEREIASLDDESDELRDQLEEIRELLRMYSSEEQVFDPNDLFEHENSDIQDWANQVEEQGYELTLDTLKKHGQDISNRIDELENDITTRNERLTELNNLIGQHESIAPINEEDKELSNDEKFKKILEHRIEDYKNELKELQGLYEEINKIINDKKNFDPNALINHENQQIAQWANNLKINGGVINIEALQEYGESIEKEISDYKVKLERNQESLNRVNDRINGVRPSGNTSSQPVQEQANANEALGESANNATGAVEGLSQAQRQGVQAGQQAGETARNASESLHAEADAANADADAQDRLAASRQNANNAKPPSTSSNPSPASTPENPPTHPETPVNTNNIEEMDKEKGKADELIFKFTSAAEAKQAFVDANKEVKASADASAESMEKESKAALKAKFGFDPEELEKTINTTQQIQSLLTQVSTAIDQMGKGSDTTGIVNQLTKVAEAMGSIVESAQQAGKAMSAMQVEGELKVDLQNGLNIQPLVAQFDALNKKTLALIISLAKVQSAIGTIDKNSEMPNLLSQIQTIASSLDTISQKDLGINFNISNTGNTIQQQAAKDREALKELRSQAETLGNYFANNLGKDWEGMLRREGGDNYFKTLWSTQDVLDDKKSTNEEKMEAYKRRIADLKQYAIEAGAAIESILPKEIKAPEKIIDDAKNFALTNAPIEQLKQILGGNTSSVLNDILSEIQNIISALNNMNSTLSSLSDGSKLTGLKEVFEQIPQKIGEATQKILELKQQIDTAQFSAGFDEQFKGLTEQLEAAKEQTKTTNEELAKTKKLLEDETQARKKLQSEIDKYKTQEANNQRKANAEEKKTLEAEKKALETEKNNLAKQLETERKQRTEKAEAQNKKLLDEQAKQQNKIERDQLKAEEKAKREEEKAQKKAADEALSKQYKDYGKDVKSTLTAKSIQELETAAKHVEETKQRIFNQASIKPEENIFGAQLGDNFKKAAEQQIDSLKQIEDAQATYVSNTITEYEKQKTALEQLDTAYKYNPDDNTERTRFLVNNKGEDIRAYVENVDNATMALERLKEIIDSMKNGTFNFMNASALKEVMELQSMLSQNVIGVTSGDKTYKAQIAAQEAATKAAKEQAEQEALSKAQAATKKPIADLNKLEKDLEKIKSESENLIVIDPTLEGQLKNVEQALEKIREIKQTLADKPLTVFDAKTNSVTEQVKQDIQSVTETFKSAKSSITESKNLLANLPASFTGYGNSLSKLFNEINNPKATIASIDAIYEAIQTYTDRISMATNMERPDFLTGILSKNAPDKAVLNQGAALDKVTLEFERFHSQVVHEAESTKTDLTKVLGEDLFKDIIEKSDFSGIDKIFSQGSFKDKAFTTFKEDIYSASESFDHFQKVAKEMQGMSIEKILGNPDIVKEYVGSLHTLEESLENIKQGAKNFSIVDESELQKLRAKYKGFLDNNPAISLQGRQTLTTGIEQLQTGINNFDASNVVRELDRVINAEKEAGNTGGTFISMLTQRFKSLGAYLLTFVSFYRVIGVFKDGINIIHELDDALTEMQKVSDESLSSLREYQKGTFATANEIGTTASQLQQSTADWLRLGEDLQNASQSAQTANILFNVSEFENINDATTALVAMSAAYADAEKDIDKMDIVDRLNLIGNNYAIATDELATALQDGAATLQTAGKQHCQNL